MASVRNAVESVDDRALKAFQRVKHDVKHLNAEVLDIRRRTDVLDENMRNKLYRLQNINIGEFVKITQERLDDTSKELEKLDTKLREKSAQTQRLDDDVSYQTKEISRYTKKLDKLEEETKLTKTELREIKKGLNKKVLDELSIYNREYTDVQKENAKLRRDIDKQTEELSKFKEMTRQRVFSKDMEIRELRREMLEKERVMEKDIREIKRLLGNGSSSTTSSKKKVTKQSQKDQEEVAQRLEHLESQDKESKKSFFKWIITKDKDLDSIDEVKDND